MKNLIYILGGPQGGGLETTSQVLSWAFSRSGYGILSDREYFSNIVGRHSYVHTAVASDEYPRALCYPINMLGAMDPETVFTHWPDLSEGAYLIYNSDTNDTALSRISSMEPELATKIQKRFSEIGVDGTISSLVKHLKEQKSINPVPISFRDALQELQKRANVVAAQASRYISTIIIGAAAALAGINEDSVKYGLQRRFKSDTVFEHNSAFSEMIIRSVSSNFGTPLKLDQPALKSKLLVASGNDVVAMAKVVSGLRFQSYYPITPAADESFTLEEHQKLGDDGSVLVFQTEDELAAIGSAIGSSLAGARSSAATSGPGFDLMVEGLGWAGINEVPLVITYYQRGGPSTGQPTRGSQSDLLSSVFASHGEYPRIVLASGDHEEAFWDTVDAFNLAEKYQVPVIHLLDKFLANTIASVPVPDISGVSINRGKLAEPGLKEYRRFFAEGSVPQRAALGEYVMWYSGDEHNELGHITEESENRVKMMERRMGKLDEMEREIPEERRVTVYGEERPDVVLYGWGFVKGAAIRAVHDLKSENVKAMYVHVRTFVPYPTRTVKRIVDEVGAERLVDVEHNYEAQAATMMRINTGVLPANYVLKYTGRPIYSDELVRAVKSVMSGERRVVLEYGA